MKLLKVKESEHLEIHWRRKACEMKERSNLKLERFLSTRGQQNKTVKLGTKKTRKITTFYEGRGQISMDCRVRHAHFAIRLIALKKIIGYKCLKYQSLNML